MKTILINLFCNGVLLLIAYYCLPATVWWVALGMMVIFCLPLLLKLVNPEEYVRVVKGALLVRVLTAYDSNLKLVVLDLFIDVVFLSALAYLGSWPLFVVMLYGHIHGWWTYYSTAMEVKEREDIWPT